MATLKKAAKPLTRGQKAAETRKRNATANQSGAQAAPAPIPVSLEKVFMVFTEGLGRLEKAILHSGYGHYPERDDSPNLGALGYTIPRITEAPHPAQLKQETPQEGPPPLQDLLGESARSSSQIRDKAVSLKHRILYGDTPMGSEAMQPNDVASYGPAKDTSLYVLRNLSEVDAMLDFFASYFIS